MKRTATVQSSAAKTTSGVTPATAVQGHRVACLVAVSAVSGTTPSMTVSLEWSNDGSTWYTGDPADAMTAITTAVNKAKDFISRGQFVRAAYAITGTTPSFTFTVDFYSRG
jgi:hypothetical protein